MLPCEYIMSAREKSITLYSRNGIKIIKTTHIDTTKYHNKTYAFEETSRTEILEKDVYEFISPKRLSHYEYKKCESKLGFYYTKRIWIDAANKSTLQLKGKKVDYTKYIIWVDGEKYELEYPRSYISDTMTQTINKYDNRPWDIVPGYKGIPDHFITALYKEVMKFIDVMYEYKNKIEFKNGVDYYKNNIMIDLFGNENGPQEQPNNIKIEAHGFDTKISFRKRKEL